MLRFSGLHHGAFQTRVDPLTLNFVRVYWETHSL